MPRYLRLYSSCVDKLLLACLLIIPILGIFAISSTISYESNNINYEVITRKNVYYKRIAIIAAMVNLIISLIIYALFDFTTNQFQFVQEHYELNFFDLYLGVDGISIYFVLLTTMIMPIALISN